MLKEDQDLNGRDKFVSDKHGHSFSSYQSVKDNKRPNCIDKDLRLGLVTKNLVWVAVYLTN